MGRASRLSLLLCTIALLPSGEVMGARATPAAPDVWLPTVTYFEQLDTGEDDADEVKEVAADDHGYYVTGTTSGRLKGEVVGEGRLFLTAHHPSGERRWARQFGTPEGGDNVNSLVPIEGGVLAAGRTSGTMAPGGSPAWADGWVRRYAEDGDTVWTTQFGTPDRPSGVGDIAAAGDRIYAVGGVDSGDATSSWFHITVLDARTGAVLDRREWSVTQYDRLSAVAVIDGDPVVAGTSWGEVTTSAGHTLGTYGVLMRLDASTLEPVWFAQVNANVYGVPHSLESDGHQLYLAGEQVDGGYYPTLSAWDSSGNRKWIVGIGGEVGHSNRTSVAVTSRGLVLGGSSTQFGADEGTGDLATIVGLSFGGRPEWGLQFGTHAEEQVTSVAAATWGMVAGGWTDGDLTDPDGPGYGDNGFYLVLTTYLPDLQVKGTAGWRDVGAQTVAQRATVRVRRGGTGVLRVRISNEGDRVDSFRSGGCTGIRGIGTTVREDGRDVTRRWRTGRWRSQQLAPGESAELSLRFARPASGPAPVRQCRLTTSSVADKRATDLAEIRVGRPS